MNLNKFTKAELIGKLNNINKKGGSPDLKISLKSYFSQIWDLIITFKALLLKLTLIGLLIKIFKRYRIFRIMWSTLTGIVMTIFGISTIDNFGFTPFIDEIKSISYNIINYFSNTSFYNYLKELYGYKTPKIDQNDYESIKNVEKEVIKPKTIEKIEDPKSDSLRERYNRSKLAEWLKPKADENYRYPPSDLNIIHSEKDATESWFNWKYILIGGAVITIGCFGYVYIDEIRDGGIAIMDWIFSWRNRGDTGTDTTTNSPTSSNTNNTNNSSVIIKDSSRDINPENIALPNSPDIELVDQKRLFSSPSLESLIDKSKNAWKAITPEWNQAESTSPDGSIDSNETIKASSSKIKIEDVALLTDSETSELVKSQSPFPFNDSELDLNTETKGKSVEKSVEALIEKTSIIKNNPFGGIDELNFYNYIENADIRHNIKYIETHLPKSELSDTTFVEKLMEEVKKYINENINLLKENYENLDGKEITIRNGVIHELAEWINKNNEKIHKFDNI